MNTETPGLGRERQIKGRMHVHTYVFICMCVKKIGITNVH